MIECRKYITRKMLRDEPNTLFVFGDNIARSGLGGQAKEMRGELNAVGIPTKKFPSNSPSAFFSDQDYSSFISESAKDWKRIENHLKSGNKVVWPSDGIGTGLADLKNKAPSIMKVIDDSFNYLNGIGA